LEMCPLLQRIIDLKIPRLLTRLTDEDWAQLDNDGFIQERKWEDFKKTKKNKKYTKRVLKCIFF
jgi:hypothetical protein